MSSIIKVDNIQNQSGANIIKEDSNTITLGASGDTVTLASGASQSGFGRTGTVDWQTGSIKTSTFTAASGEGYFVNTNGGAVTVNLPAGVAGAIVGLKDYAGTWDSNAVTLNPNGSDKIGGGADSDPTLESKGGSTLLVFVDSTQGWLTTQESVTESPSGIQTFVSATGGTITTSGDCKIHTFTGPGTFAVSQIASDAANNIMSHVVVAGGAGGGGHGGAGGGAGGFREVKNPATPYTASPLDGYPSSPNRVTVTATSFPIIVGGGGAGGCNTKGVSGGVSTFSTVTSAGGGGGGGGHPAPNYADAASGGSGGGGGCSSGKSGGSGNTPPVSPPQGNNGGNTGDPFGGGGGGGATAVGAVCATIGGAGGAGATSSIIASPTAYAGGGGGSKPGIPADGGGAGGTGGGGKGGNTSGTMPSNSQGTTNTGGGGGGNHGGPPAFGGAGGSGIVIIRYKFQ